MGYRLHGCSPRWATFLSTIGSLPNHSTCRSTNGNREPLTIVTCGGETSTPTWVRPAMALPQMRVPGVGNQDGNCTEVDAPVHDHALCVITGDAVYTRPLRGRLPEQWGDGRAASSRIGDDTLHCGTSNQATGETHESHRWATMRLSTDEYEDGSCGTTHRLTSSVGSGISVAGHTRTPGQDRRGAAQGCHAVRETRHRVFRCARQD